MDNKNYTIELSYEEASIVFRLRALRYGEMTIKKINGEFVQTKTTKSEKFESSQRFQRWLDGQHIHNSTQT